MGDHPYYKENFGEICPSFDLRIIYLLNHFLGRILIGGFFLEFNLFKGFLQVGVVKTPFNIIGRMRHKFKGFTHIRNSQKD